jgi:transposase
MHVVQAFRFELDPNCATRVALAKHVGAARFAYNWGLARCLEALERGERIPSAVDLHKEWNRWKREHAPWWVEVSKCAPQEAFRDLEQAIRRWRKRLAGRPRFKCAWYGARLILAPRDFPSTRRCSRCGCIGPRLPLSERIFRCAACGLEMDRDENSAFNLRSYGLAVLNGSTGSSPGSDACGDPSGGGTANGRSTSHGSWKQEATGHVFHPGGERNGYALRNGYYHELYH